MGRHTVLVDGLIDGGTVEHASRDAGYQTPDPRLRDGGTLLRWLLATGLMLVLHAFWWFWLSPREIVSGAPLARAVHLRVLAGEAGQRIWTPTVLALPTDIGFSGSGITAELGEGPSIRTPRGPVHFLERDAYHAETDDGDEVWTRPPLIVRSPPPPAPADAPARLPPAAGYRVRFNGRLLEDAGLALPPAGDRPWSVTAWIEPDPHGRVGHALIETPSEADGIDRAVLHALYQWRLPPTLRDGAGTITIRYVPAGAPPP